MYYFHNSVSETKLFFVLDFINFSKNVDFSNWISLITIFFISVLCTSQRRYAIELIILKIIRYKAAKEAWAFLVFVLKSVLHELLVFYSFIFFVLHLHLKYNLYIFCLCLLENDLLVCMYVCLIARTLLDCENFCSLISLSNLPTTLDH